jgi:hypothetical protein
MVAHDCLTQQINPEVARLMNQLVIEPQLAMIEILPADRIIPQQKTAANRAIHHMHNRNFIRRKHLHARQPCYDQTSFPKYPATSNAQISTDRPPPVNKLLCPRWSRYRFKSGQFAALTRIVVKVIFAQTLIMALGHVAVDG